jgi:hypothetical protein
MPNPKRTIPVSEVKVGDSIGLPGIQDVRFVYDRTETADGETTIYTLSPTDDHRAFAVDRDPDAPVKVGYTNRKAKRLRGKMARRARLKELDRVG